MHKICEDCCDQFNSEELKQSLEVLIPKFIRFFSHSSPTIKSHAIACVNQFVINQPPALVANIVPFIRVGCAGLSVGEVTVVHFSAGAIRGSWR